ncbi:MAG: FtsX-like permease family protein [Luteitalea sp.]|nr:FtsX-like permease family protein [Luteitalea sp.]
MLRVRSLLARRRLDADLAAELESHLQLHVDDKIRAGMTPDEARRQAVLMLGGIEQTKERYRDRRGFRPLDEIAQDVRYAARLLRKNLGLTSVAIVSLALGIGANAAIFSLFNHMLLRALPVPDPNRLVNLTNPGPRSGGCTTGPFGDCDSVFSYPMFQDLERLQSPGPQRPSTGSGRPELAEGRGSGRAGVEKVLSGIGAYRWFDANLSYRGETLSGGGLVVSGNYFPVLGVQPALGRLIGPGDDRAVGESDVLVLSHAYWRQRFGANPNAVNDTIVVNGRRMTIVGIAPPGFEGTTLEYQPDVYVPITMLGYVNPGWDEFDNRLNYSFYLFARLHSAVSMEQARTAMNTVYRGIINHVEAALQADMSEKELAKFKAKTLGVDPGRRGLSSLRGEVRTPLTLLLAATGAVLLIACANHREPAAGARRDARERAELEINVPYRAQVEQDIQLLSNPGGDFLERFRARRITLEPGQYGRGTLDDEWGTPLLLLMGMTVLVLLIACANVANLQLARATARVREVAVRTAMGASRTQLVRQFLTESCLLAVAGGALGISVAYWTQRAILVSLPPWTGIQDLELTSLDHRVLFFCLGLSVLTGILFGLFPALQASKTDLTSCLKDQAGQISSTGRGNVFQKTLIVAQVAVSLLLLISAGLFAGTLVNVARIDPGIRADHLMTFSLGPKLHGYTDERIAQLHEQLTSRLSRIPGVVLVSSAWAAVITGSTSRMRISVEGYTPPSGGSAKSNYNRVGADYFRTMGTPLIAGREFTRADNTAAPPVAIVNEAFVQQFLPNQDPLGRHLGSGSDEALPTTIVGVVENAKFSRMREDTTPTFYRPLRQSDEWDSLSFYLRTTIPPESTLPLIRHHLAALDSSLAIGEAKTMQAQIEESLFAERILSFLTGTVAGLAVLLAAIGVYGVLAYNVARRTREIGIRMALGADAGDVRALVVREVAVMLVVGTVIGLASAAAASQLVQSFLYGLQPWDVLTYALAVAALWLVALAAAGIPARRATSVDPTVALRYE